MRVLHVVAVIDAEYTYGGPLTVAAQQVRVLRAAGHDAVLVGGHPRGARPGTTLDGVPTRTFPVVTVIPRLRFSGLLSPGLLWWLWRSARDFDVVQVHLARDLVPLTAALVLRRRGVPWVVQTHGMVEPDARPVARVLDALLTRPALRGASSRLLLTEREHRDIVAVAGDGRGHVVLPHSVDVPTTPPREDREPPEVLFLARLHPRKRVMDFVRAARIARERGLVAADVVFCVVGPDDGDLPALRAALASGSSAPGVRYEGALDHAAAGDRFARAALYVLPAVDEPLGMTLLEAAAQGTPSICCRTCGLAAPLAGAGAAVVVEDGDVEELARAIGGLLGDPRRLREMGRAARRFAQDHHAPAVVEQMLLERYALAISAAR